MSFALKDAGWYLPLANEVTKETSPAEALEKVGTVMPRIIKALRKYPLSDNPIHLSKLYIKDGFWRILCAVGEE